MDDSLEVICLLAIKQLGGQAVPAKQDLFAKGLKSSLKSAVDKGYVLSEKVAVSVTGKSGKPKLTKIDALTLSPSGESFLKASVSPETLANARQGEIKAIQLALHADREKLRADVVGSLESLSDQGPVGSKEISAMTKSIADLSKRLEKIELQLQRPTSQDILRRIDDAFALLFTQVNRIGEIDPTENPTPTPRVRSLREQIRESYQDLHGLLEYQDGLVPLPRLFHQTQSQLPRLTIAAFHEELLKLWDERAVVLVELNEVGTAAEPEKAIRRGDSLYYFVLWKDK